jgi:hypothetical protein
MNVVLYLHNPTTAPKGRSCLYYHILLLHDHCKQQIFWFSCVKFWVQQIWNKGTQTLMFNLQCTSIFSILVQEQNLQLQNYLFTVGAQKLNNKTQQHHVFYEMLLQNVFKSCIHCAQTSSVHFTKGYERTGQTTFLFTLFRPHLILLH